MGYTGAPQVVLSVPAEQLTYTWRWATPLPSMSAFVGSPRQMRLQSPGSPGTPLKFRSKPQARDWYPLRWCRPRERATGHEGHGRCDGGRHRILFIPGSHLMGGGPWMVVPFAPRARSACQRRSNREATLLARFSG